MARSASAASPSKSTDSPTPRGVNVTPCPLFRVESQIHRLPGRGGDRGQFCWHGPAERGAGRAERAREQPDDREPDQHEEVNGRARAGILVSYRYAAILSVRLVTPWLSSPVQPSAMRGFACSISAVRGPVPSAETGTSRRSRSPAPPRRRCPLAGDLDGVAGPARRRRRPRPRSPRGQRGLRRPAGPPIQQGIPRPARHQRVGRRSCRQLMDR